MAYHFEAFSPVFESHIDSPLIRSYISMFWDYLQADKQKRRKLIFKFTDQVIFQHYIYTYYIRTYHMYILAHQRSQLFKTTVNFIRALLTDACF